MYVEYREVEGAFGLTGVRYGRRRETDNNLHVPQTLIRNISGGANTSMNRSTDKAGSVISWPCLIRCLPRGPHERAQSQLLTSLPVTAVPQA